MVFVPRHVDSRMALAELLSLLVDEKADVGEFRRFPAEGIVQLHVFWR